MLSVREAMCAHREPRMAQVGRRRRGGPLFALRGGMQRGARCRPGRPWRVDGSWSWECRCWVQGCSQGWGLTADAGRLRRGARGAGPTTCGSAAPGSIGTGTGTRHRPPGNRAPLPSSPGTPRFPSRSPTGFVRLEPPLAPLANSSRILDVVQACD